MVLRRRKYSYSIARSVKTAPAVQDVVLRFDWDWEDSDFTCVRRLDWSPLALLQSDSAAHSPRIRLCIGSANEGRPIAPESIIDALLENEALWDLVKRDLVVLELELDRKTPWKLTDFLNF